MDLTEQMANEVADRVGRFAGHTYAVYLLVINLSEAALLIARIRDLEKDLAEARNQPTTRPIQEAFVL